MDKIEVTQLKAMVEALDNALNDVIGTLKKSFAKYKKSPVLFILSSVFNVFISLFSDKIKPSKIET